MIMKLCLRQNKNEDHCLGSGLFLSKISWKCPSDFDIFLCMLSLYWECLEKDKGARILKDKKQKMKEKNKSQKKNKKKNKKKKQKKKKKKNKKKKKKK